MEPSYINVVAALSFVIVSIIITISLFYIEEDKKNLYNNKNNMQSEYIDMSEQLNHYKERQNDTVRPYPMKYNDMIHISHEKPNLGVKYAIHNKPRMIEENERINFITKCNHVDKELQGLLSKQMMLYNRDQKNILLEKKLYINKIRDIVNDLAFTNKREFEQLYIVLK